MRGHTWETDIIIQIIYYAVCNVLALTDATSSGAGPASSPPSAEAILDQALHLVMLGVVERPRSFSTLASRKKHDGFGNGKTLVSALWTLGGHEKYAKLYKARVDWILDRIEAQVPDKVQQLRKPAGKHDLGSRIPPVDRDEERKKAAKKRQEMILQQMKAQQASFASAFGDVDSDGDEDAEGAEGDEEMNEGFEKAGEEEIVSFGTCIVCQDDLNTTNATSKPFGSLRLIQASRLIRRHPGGDINYLNGALTSPPHLDHSAGNDITTFPPPQADLLDSQANSHNFEGFPLNFTRFGLHGSVCSHLMHLECFQVYSISIRHRHHSQASRNHPECIPQKEYICPLCNLLRHVLVLTYYACLARTIIGLVYILNKYRNHIAVQVQQQEHEEIFGDLRIFFMSIVRHSPIFEHTATMVFENFGEARIERLLYIYSLQFLRRAAILC